MAEGILGLGSSGAAGLSQELIDKLKAAEAKGKVVPLTKDLEDWDKELEKITEIENKVTELLSKITSYDLYTSGSNAFEQVLATTTGSSASFNAIDISGLTAGSNTINISQLAQRDVYQTAIFTDKDIQVAGGEDSGDNISINIDGADYDFATDGKTYQELADEINANIKLTASMEQVGDSEYRLVIKSTDTGLANALTITQTGVDLGISSQVTSQYYENTAIQIIGGEDDGDKITINGIDFTTKDESLKTLRDKINTDGTFEASVADGRLVIKSSDGSDLNITQTGLDMGFSSAILSAQNMKAQVDGVSYDVSSNTITIQGNLTMTAVELGTSTITIEEDNSSIMPGLQDFVATYNELVTLVDDELYADDSVIGDTSSLRLLMSSIKDKLFADYGDSADKNIFNYGFNLDASGFMSIDTEVFGNALSTNLDDIKALFIGTAENPGLGTMMKEYLDGLDGYDGLLTMYGESMATRKTDLEEEKDTAQKELDTKYSLMAQQFASYTALITQMEASFGGMKMMMESKKE